MCEGRVGLGPWLPSSLRAGDSSSESPLAFSFSVLGCGGELPSPASADFWLLEELLPSSRLGLHCKEVAHHHLSCTLLIWTIPFRWFC